MKKWFLLLNISALSFLFISTGEAAEFSNTPQLIVKGEASIFKPTDQMEVLLGVVTSAENSSIALNENNQRMHQIIANLRMLGLDETDYQTGRFHIRPIYQKISKDSEEENRAKIIRYEALNNIQIKTKKIALADNIINVAVQGGANQVETVNFSLNSPQAYREEVIKLATQNALMDASALSHAAGVRLIRIINLSLDHWQQFPAPMMMSKQAEGSNQITLANEAIKSGQAEIHALVNVIFEIGSEGH